MKRRHVIVSAIGITSLAGCSTGPTEEEMEEYEKMENAPPPTVVETGHKYDPSLEFSFSDFTGGIVAHVDIKNDQPYNVEVKGEIILLDGGTKLEDAPISKTIEPNTTARIYEQVAATETVSQDITSIEFRDLEHNYYPTTR